MRLVDEGYITLTYNDPIPEAGFRISMRWVFVGYNDVGDKFMLETTFCWWQFEEVSDKSLCRGLFCEVNRSPTSRSCYQHESSPTSIINIDVAVKVYFENWFKSYSFVETSAGFVDSYKVDGNKITFEINDSKDCSQSASVLKIKIRCRQLLVNFE